MGSTTAELAALPGPHRVCAVNIHRQKVLTEIDEVDVVG
jgi:hypothetical protein